MSAVLADLVSVLSPQRVEENLFRARSIDFGWGQVFGGQVLGQAVSAASQTVAENGESVSRSIHSLHAYFLRLGDVSKPIDYAIDRTRDGKSFSTRRVVAYQSGLPIFQCACSFHAGEPGFEHQDPMPSIPGPDGLLDERELWRAHLKEIPEPMHVLALGERPIELRPVDPVDILKPSKKGVDHAVWMRTNGSLRDDPDLHRSVLAYCSDFAFVVTAMRPHGVMWTDPSMQVASIDHSIWFHRPFRIDDWLLHVMHSPSAYGSRGFARGSVFTRDGTLVASTAQEGLMRRR